MVEGERPKSLEPCLELTLKLVCHLPPYIRLLNQTFQNPPPQFLSQFLWPVGRAGGHTIPPTPLKFIVMLRQKFRQRIATERPLKATERQENLYFCLELYTIIGCHPPYSRLLNQTFKNPPPQFLTQIYTFLH